MVAAFANSPAVRSAPQRHDAEMPDVTRLIERLLADQQDLSAVQRFARKHDAGEVPEQARYYRDLLPAHPPAEGEQYAFEVDLDACTGCMACVTACSTLNGLDPGETWRSVGLLVSRSTSLPVLQHVTAACHHCVEPACMHGCPVLAYEKDPSTGIVRHLDDQCIGCQYCILKCPYDVPKYNSRLGIVRKCDMCTDRLAAGEAPACVQGCPNQAIRIGVVRQSQVRQSAQQSLFLPGAHDPDYTLPTTSYRSAVRPSVPSGLIPSDHHRVSPEHAHWPLIVMLVLTQLSAGAFAVGQLLGWLTEPQALAVLRPLHAAVALGLGLLALGASVFHLGRPLYAFRAVLGLRTSWLSREIVAFGAFAALAVAYATCTWMAPTFIAPGGASLLGSAVALLGLAGVVCSVMVYHDTRREFWRLRHAGPSFLLSALLLGVAATLLAALLSAASSSQLGVPQALRGWAQVACAVMAVVSLVKLSLGLLVVRHLWGHDSTPMARTARLLTGPLLRTTLARIGSGLIGGVMLPLLARAVLSGASANAADLVVLIGAAFTMTLVSELIERYLFFTAVVAYRMPGGLAT
jgi:Fe-S-cluster-containing dehydrogenase component/DMSO reductase anchor subunit